jgi:hypothetical protein
MPTRIQEPCDTDQTPQQTLEDADDGLLFSCRCESARPIATLLSCLRNVSLSSNASGTPSYTSMQMATQSLLSSTDRRLTQGGGMSMGGGSSGSRMQYASVFCSEKGLTFQVYGVGRQSRATVDISAGLFSEFYVAEQRLIVEEEDDDDCVVDHERVTSSSLPKNTMMEKGRVEVIKGGEFGINLSTVLGCLMVLGPSSLDRTTLCLSYDASEAIFKIELL